MNKKYQESIYFDADGNNSDTFIASHSIALEIAKYNHFSNNRSVRRARQSLAVRDLLNSSLQKLFSEEYCDSWVVNKTLSGKPFLGAKDSPSISISHSGDWCACSVAASFIIGVDVEVIKPRDWEVYCRDVFHPEEARWVLDVYGHERDARGLICWYGKESIVKALGQACN